MTSLKNQKNRPAKEFMCIKLAHWPGERIFSLFLKYDIRQGSSLDFVKNFVSELAADLDVERHVIKLSNLKLKLDNRQTALLEEGRDYLVKNEEVISKEKLLEYLRFAMSNPEKAKSREALPKPTLQETKYVTIPGIISLKRLLKKEEQTEELESAFSKIVFWAAVMTDTNRGQKPYGTV